DGLDLVGPILVQEVGGNARLVQFRSHHLPFCVELPPDPGRGQAGPPTDERVLPGAALTAVRALVWRQPLALGVNDQGRNAAELSAGRHRQPASSRGAAPSSSSVAVGAPDAVLFPYTGAHAEHSHPWRGFRPAERRADRRAGGAAGEP